MFRFLRQVGLGMAVCIASSALGSQRAKGGQTSLELDAALSRRKVEGSTVTLTRSLEEAFRGSESTRLEALDWIGSHQRVFSTEDLVAAVDLYEHSVPTANENVVRGLRQYVAERRLSESAPEIRSAIYRRAVEQGGTDVTGGGRVSRTMAIAWASLEGLGEFETDIDRYREEIDRIRLDGGARRSDELSWYLRLRKGAKDRTTAERLHLQRVLSMRADQVVDLFEQDVAFRETAFATLRRLSESGEAPCRELKVEARAVGVEWSKRQGVGTGEGRWLERIQEATATCVPNP